jgi:hypothetical protein
MLGYVPNFQAFADRLLEIAWEGCDADGDEIQRLALAFGLLRSVRRDEPCGDNCRCAEYGEFPLVCYRKTY